MKIGPNARALLTNLYLTWDQGDHVLITGGTGSGKTLLAHYLDEIRVARGGSVVVFICKLRPDDTIKTYYTKKKGWVRWKTWKKFPLSRENRILLWPDVEGKTPEEAVRIMRREFRTALAQIGSRGDWTVHIDEGLFMTAPHELGFAGTIGTMYSLMRSSKATMITLAQRPSNLPLSIYANTYHSFVGSAKEAGDVKRLADLNSSISSKEMQQLIRANGMHDFLYVKSNSDEIPRKINLAQ